MTDAGGIGPRRSAPPVAKPDGFSAPYDAFEPRFADHQGVTLLMLGLEVRHGAEIPAALEEKLANCLASHPAPEIHEYGATTGEVGPDAHMHFLYWRNHADYERWEAASGILDVFADAALLQGNLGLWRELAYISLDHNETSGSRPEPLTGLTNFADERAITPHHGYWGSARDRIVAAAEDDLASDAPVGALLADGGLGQRISVEAPENTCLIRSSQDLSQASEPQAAMYRASVKPALMGGLHYLEDNGAESGCAGVRFVREDTSAAGGAERTCVTGFFRSFADLENWTRDHPTHHAIMGSFMSMVEAWKGQPGLHLWHEITIFPAGTLFGDYVNCTVGGTLMRVGRDVPPTHVKIQIPA